MSFGFHAIRLVVSYGQVREVLVDDEVVVEVRVVAERVRARS